MYLYRDYFKAKVHSIAHGPLRVTYYIVTEDRSKCSVSAVFVTQRLSFTVARRVSVFYADCGDLTS